MRAPDLGTGDGSLQRVHVLRVGRVLQEHYHQVRRVALRLSGERGALDHCSPLLPTAHKEVRFEAQPFLCLHFEQSLELGAGSPIAPKHEVASLEQRPNVAEAEPGDEVAQVGHRDRVVSTEIDGAEQGDAGRHTQAPPTLWSRAARAMNHPV